MQRLLGILAATTLAVAPASALLASGATQPTLPVAAIEAAAAQGGGEAIATLGWMYETGTGAPQDLAKAAALYRSAVSQGDSFGQWRLGVMIDEGKTAGTREQAVTLFRQAAAAKSPGATASLGVMYATGRGVTRDYDAAMRYYQAAARMGSAHAIEGLGVLYANGQGVGRDMAEALAHWIVAAAAGDKDAAALLDQHMPASTAAEADPIYDRANAIADAYGMFAADGLRTALAPAYAPTRN